MKAAGLALAMMGCAVLIHGTSYAFSPSPAPQGQSSENSAKRFTGDHATDAASADQAKGRMDRTPLDERDHRHDSDRSQARSHINVTKANRPAQPRDSQQHFTSGNGTDNRQLVPGRSSGVIRGRLIQSARINNDLPARPPTVGGPTATTLSSVRHRSPNPATINGSVNPKTGDTGAINGTRMRRRR